MISTTPEVGQFLRIDFTNGTRYAVVHRIIGNDFVARALTRAASKGQHGWLIRKNDPNDYNICTVLPCRPSKQEVAATYPALPSSVQDTELTQLKADAARYRHIRDNHVWHRIGNMRDGFAIVGLKFPYDTGFSCAAMLDFHIDKAIKDV